MRRAPPLALAAATAAYASITLTYALSVPLGSSADEASHLTYARLIADHAALPGADVPERQQPPLYYLLSAVLLRLQAPDVALRLLSIAIGVVTIALVARTVRHLSPRRPWLVVGTAAALALLPGFQFVSSSVTDDSVATAAGAWLLLVATRVALAAAPSTRLLLWVGCSAGVALIAKETDYPVLIVLAAVVVWRWRDSLALRHALPVAVPVAAIAGWWYARNLILFHRPLPPLTPLGVPPDRLRTLGQLRAFGTQSLHGLLSPERYQGSPLILPSGGQVLLAVFALALLAGVAAGAVLAARCWRRWDQSRRTAVVAFAAAFAGAAAFSFGNALIVVFQPQGRYLLVAATGPLLALVWGVQRLARTRPPVWAASAAYIACTLSLSVIGLTAALSAS